MDDELLQTRVDQLMTSPAGCMFLVLADANDVDSDALSDPTIILPLISYAVGEMIPWVGAHDEIVRLARVGAEPLHDYAFDLLANARIDFLWAPVDRAHQTWIQPDSRPEFPTAATFQSPPGPSSRMWFYVHSIVPRTETSTEIAGTNSLYESLIAGKTDWRWPDGNERASVTISSSARIKEIVTAQDWHDFVARYPLRSEPRGGAHPHEADRPWGSHDGLVPDWTRVARDWEGVHITTWAYLTATQVRIASNAGWTEAWSWESEHTVWLHWVFDSVQALPPIDGFPRQRSIALPIGFRNNPYTPLGQYRRPS